MRSKKSSRPEQIDLSLRWDRPGSGWMLAGALLYLVGTFGVTIAINVPMNVQLESADAGSAEGDEVWHWYLRRWTAWNTLRTILGAAASALLVTSLV